MQQCRCRSGRPGKIEQMGAFGFIELKRTNECLEHAV